MRYNAPNTPQNALRDLLFRGGIPVTTTLLLVNAVTFLAAFMFKEVYSFFDQRAVMDTETILRSPWTFLTYPLVYLDVTSNGLWNFLMGGFLFWTTGGSLERSWGSARYTVFFFGMAVVSALFLILGSHILGQQGALFGFFLPMACCAIAFCMLNPEASMGLFFFAIPAKFFAILVALYTWVYIGQGGRPLLGLFGCGGLVVSLLYVRYGRSWADIGSYRSRRAPPRGPDLRIYPKAANSSFRTMDGSPRRSPFDLSGRLKDWRERRRLERLFKNSGFSGSEADWREDEKKRP